MVKVIYSKKFKLKVHEEGLETLELGIERIAGYPVKPNLSIASVSQEGRDYVAIRGFGERVRKYDSSKNNLKDVKNHIEQSFRQSMEARLLAEELKEEYRFN
ncbi:hypothetical protein ACFLZZ_00880 [Nanoarchaeota archaeon]